MGLVQKIFYTHLPLAWWSFVSFFLVCVSGVAYLKTRNRHWTPWPGPPPKWAWCSAGWRSFPAPSGAPFVGRLVDVGPAPDHDDDSLVPLCGLPRPAQDGHARERQANLCAVVGIVAFVDVPLVFLSARLWRSIHPAVFANKSGGLEPEMKIAAIAAVACFGLVWAVSSASVPCDQAERTPRRPRRSWRVVI